jgi:hypothetical protein
MQQSYNPQGVRETWDRRRRGLVLGLSLSAAILLLGLLRAFAEPVDAAVMLVVGGIGAVVCVFGLLRSR